MECMEIILVADLIMKCSVFKERDKHTCIAIVLCITFKTISK